MNKIIRVYNKIDFFSVYWKLTDFCNFSCSYCPAYLHSGDYANGKKAGYPTDEQIINCVKTLKEYAITSNKKLLVSIAGGEPTTHPMFGYITEQLHSYGTITVITNGSRSINWWNNLDKLPHRVVISLHPEFSKIDKINTLATWLIDKKVGISFNLSCDPNNWSKMLSMYNLLDSNLITFVNPKILQKTDYEKQTLNATMTYDSAQWEWINETAKKYVNTDNESGFVPRTMVVYESLLEDDATSVKFYEDGSNSYIGWKCSAGSAGISISYDGNVSAGICSVRHLGKLDNFKLLNDFLFCVKNKCACPGDHILDKFNPLYK